jgi:glycosyltransferase involved in cell wall biosynthesis
MIARNLTRAKSIACDSLKTQQDLTEILGIEKKKTVHIPLCSFYPYSPMCEKEADRIIAQAIPTFTNFPSPYILHVGSDAWYKNRAGVLHIYKALLKYPERAEQLVFVGPPPSQGMRDQLKNFDIERRVHFIEAISNDTLRALYSRAALLLFPSQEEGFGLPILEALASGCRVITTKKAPMTEIGGDATHYIEPLNTITPKGVTEWAQESACIINDILKQNPETQAMTKVQGITHARSFSTDATIDHYIEHYQSILSR